MMFRQSSCNIQIHLLCTVHASLAHLGQLSAVLSLPVLWQVEKQDRQQPICMTSSSTKSLATLMLGAGSHSRELPSKSQLNCTDARSEVQQQHCHHATAVMDWPQKSIMNARALTQKSGASSTGGGVASMYIGRQQHRQRGIINISLQIAVRSQNVISISQCTHQEQRHGGHAVAAVALLPVLRRPHQPLLHQRLAHDGQVRNLQAAVFKRLQARNRRLQEKFGHTVKPCNRKKSKEKRP